MALETTGAVRWEAVRDGGLNTNEVPAEVLVLADGTRVLTGVGGRTFRAGSSRASPPDTGRMVRSAGRHSKRDGAGRGAPERRRCVTGGYDALVTWPAPRSAAADSSCRADEPHGHRARAKLDRPALDERTAPQTQVSLAAAAAPNARIHQGRHAARSRDHLHRLGAVTANDLQVPRPRTQRGRGFALLQLGERSDDEVTGRGSAGYRGGRALVPEP